MSKQTSYRRRKREQVIQKYGGACTCCQESTYDFLTIEHLNNDGADHRREIGRSSAELIRYIIKHDYPIDRFTVLCSNCNLAKAKVGVCPHEQARISQVN